MIILATKNHSKQLKMSSPIKKPSTQLDSLIGAGTETLTPARWSALELLWTIVFFEEVQS